jgi:hypothetical protein
MRHVTQAILAVATLALAACESSDDIFRYEPPEIVGDAVAFGIWNPSGNDTCTKADHDAYYAVGPDGLRYPTWHPAVDPSGCTFGHEHGRDPSGSDLYDEVGPIPFAYANEHLQAGGFGAPRNEDHVGHKVEWENDIVMNGGGGGGNVVSVVCDVLMKMHQGTHSADAFTNNMHEVAYHIRCSDGTGFSATVLTPIGEAGELVVGCHRENHIQVGTANPPISPDGGGQRAIPDQTCIQEHVLAPPDGRPRFFNALHESWEISVSLRAEGGRTLAGFNPYFQVRDPSRFFDATVPGLARPIDLCYRPEIRGEGACQALGTDSVGWNDPRSPFKGVRRFVDVNGNRSDNADGPNVWYTDALGRNGRTEPFPGSIRQWVAKHDTGALDLHGPSIGDNRRYDDTGVHAPN